MNKNVKKMEVVYNVVCKLKNEDLKPSKDQMKYVVNDKLSKIILALEKEKLVCNIS